MFWFTLLSLVSQCMSRDQVHATNTFEAWAVSGGRKKSEAPSIRAIFMWQFSMLQFLFARVDDEK